MTTDHYWVTMRKPCNERETRETVISELTVQEHPDKPTRNYTSVSSERRRPLYRRATTRMNVNTTSNPEYRRQNNCEQTYQIFSFSNTCQPVYYNCRSNNSYTELECRNYLNCPKLPVTSELAVSRIHMCVGAARPLKMK